MNEEQGLRTRLEIGGKGQNPPTRCKDCGRNFHQHERTRNVPDDGPAGTWHYEYECPDGNGVKKR